MKNVITVADAIVKVVDMPFGKRPFSIHMDPAQDGAEVVNAVADHIRAELVRRIGVGDLLPPKVKQQQPRASSSPAPHVESDVL
jgi:hypothetical protein